MCKVVVDTVFPCHLGMPTGVGRIVVHTVQSSLRHCTKVSVVPTLLETTPSKEEAQVTDPLAQTTCLSVAHIGCP
jgi:hypothetical protein